MGRSPFARKHTLWMSTVATVVGLAFTILAFTASYDAPATGWNEFYESTVPCEQDTCWNTAVQVLAPVVLLAGVWYLGEQILARRKFERMISEKKKSTFQKNLDELEETTKKLPHRYEERLEERTEDFVSRRRR